MRVTIWAYKKLGILEIANVIVMNLMILSYLPFHIQALSHYTLYEFPCTLLVFRLMSQYSIYVIASNFSILNLSMTPHDPVNSSGSTVTGNATSLSG